MSGGLNGRSTTRSEAREQERHGRELRLLFAAVALLQIWGYAPDRSVVEQIMKFLKASV